MSYSSRDNSKDNQNSDQASVQSQSVAAMRFADNRSEVIAQRKMQGVANNSSHVRRAVQLQNMFHNYSAQQPMQMVRMEAGKYVSDGEIHYRNLADEFYATYGFVSRVEDNGYVNPGDGRRQIISQGWLALWNEYDALWTQASSIHNYVTANKTMYGADHEWESFAVGTPLHDKRLEIIAVGGFLAKGQQGPGGIPMVADPNEVLVDNFIARAIAAYNLWMGGVKTKQNRGPKDPQGLVRAGIDILKTRALPQHWSLHPSNSGTWALHRSGNQHTPEDPDSPNGRMTFIYHT